MYPDQEITPCLWFDGSAEEAVAFYGAIFPDMGIVAALEAARAGA